MPKQIAEKWMPVNAQKEQKPAIKGTLVELWLLENFNTMIIFTDNG